MDDPFKAVDKQNDWISSLLHKTNIQTKKCTHTEYVSPSDPQGSLSPGINPHRLAVFITSWEMRTFQILWSSPKSNFHFVLSHNSRCSQLHLKLHLICSPRLHCPSSVCQDVSTHQGIFVCVRALRCVQEYKLAADGRSCLLLADNCEGPKCPKQDSRFNDTLFSEMLHGYNNKTQAVNLGQVFQMTFR